VSYETSRYPTPSSFEQLDTIDQELVRLLRQDGRASYAALAPEVGLSQAAVRARVNRLLDERVVDINGRVDPSVLGVGVFSLAFLKVKGRVEDAADLATTTPEAVFSASTTGRSDLIVELRCRDHQQLFRTLETMRSVDVVDRVESVVFLQYFKQDWSEAGNAGAHPPQVGQSSGNAPTSSDFDVGSLDDVDFRILRALMADGRRTYAELSAEVGLSRAAARERVLRLLDDVVSIQAAPGPGMTDGLVWTALLVSTSGEAERVAKVLVSLPELALVASTTGSFDLVCEMWANDPNHLMAVLDDVRSVEGIRSVEAVRYLRTLKQDFSGGIA